MQVFGIDAMVRLVSHLAFVYLAFWSMQSLNLEQYFKRGHTTQIRMFLMLFAIVIGFGASSFFLECMALIRNFALTILQ